MSSTSSLTSRTSSPLESSPWSTSSLTTCTYKFLSWELFLQIKVPVSKTMPHLIWWHVVCQLNFHAALKVCPRATVRFFFFGFFWIFFKGTRFQVTYGLLNPYPPRTATLDKWKWSYKPLEMCRIFAIFDPSRKLLHVFEESSHNLPIMVWNRFCANKYILDFSNIF